MNTGNSEKFFYTEYNVSLALFYEKALEYYHKKDFLATARMLQQTAIFTYRTLIETMGGDNDKYTHLKQIKEHLHTLLPEFKNAFPADNEQDCVLLKQLEKIYIDTEYTSDFTITEGEILQLLERVSELQDMAKEVLYKE